MSGVFDMDEDESLQLLAGKLSVIGVNSSRKAIRHVTRNVTRVLSDFPLRLNLIHTVFTTENKSDEGLLIIVD